MGIDQASYSNFPRSLKVSNSISTNTQDAAAAVWVPFSRWTGFGRGLRTVARDEAGIVQASEGISEPFLVGVQWHRGLLVFAKPQQRPFAALAAATRTALERAA